jgi:vancomycin resistance protein VanW
MYNYLDLQLKNPTSHPIQLLLHLDDNFFYGEFRTNAELPYSYRVIEKNHFFEKIEEEYFRGNELHRKVIDKRTGNTAREEFIVRNYSKVKYIPTKEKFYAKSSYDKI